MKEATGDMTATVVVIVGIIAVLGIGTWLWNGPLKNRINQEVENINTEVDKAKQNQDDEADDEAYIRIIDDYYI